jgi:hypothetical protein
MQTMQQYIDAYKGDAEANAEYPGWAEGAKAHLMDLEVAHNLLTDEGS